MTKQIILKIYFDRLVGRKTHSRDKRHTHAHKTKNGQERLTTNRKIYINDKIYSIKLYKL